jgi:Fic family protein
MDLARFTSERFGRPTRSPESGWDFWYFQPEPLPRTLPLDGETVLALSEADAALGRLSGVGRLLPQPELLIGPYLTREALASSRIEGTETSLSEVFRAEVANEPATDDVKDVENYVRAMRTGLARMQDLPLCVRLIREIHQVLLDGTRGQGKSPGSLRTGPVWIGSPTDSPHTAVFVPPPAVVADALADWERFANDDGTRMPVLVKCALLHYQFETIHPFLDGNGRLGRLLIVFYLVQQQRLLAPLLYISSYLESSRRDYYDRLQGVRERGEIQEWLQYFLTAVTRQATDAADRAGTLVDMRERYRAELAGSRSRGVELVDLIFANPIVSTRRVVDGVGLSDQGARNLISGLTRRGWLTPLELAGAGGRMLWIANEIFDVLDGSARTTTPGATH